MPSPDALYEERFMLSLALAAYRGFYLVDPGHNMQGLRRSIESGLSSYRDVAGEETALVWGPATFRFWISLFDDACVFLVKRSRDRYAVVIRGTNPIALRDWLFFDLLAGRQEPWRGDGEARVSSSTALGLRTLLGVRGIPYPQDDRTSGHLDRAPASSSRALPSLGRRALDLAAAPLLREVEPLARDAVEAARRRVPKVLARGISVPGPLKRLLDRTLDLAGDAILSGLTSALRWEVDLTSGDGEGVRLLEMLRSITAEAEGPIELAVTGHSKGGALATALALHLAETQGTETPTETAWDPERRAIIKGYAFAGPTPGNSAFAARADSVLREGDRCCRRVTNEHDVVTRAWIPAELDRLLGKYEEAYQIPGTVRALANLLVGEVSRLQYQHTQADVRRFEEPFVRSTGLGYVGEAIFQHLVAYVSELKLDDLDDLDQLLGQMDEQLKSQTQATRPSVLQQGVRVVLRRRGADPAQQAQQQTTPRIEPNELNDLRQLVRQLPGR